MGRGVREPVVAGSFYPADPKRLRAQVEGFLGGAGIAEPAGSAGLVVPHAGYMYSGAVAGKGFRAASVYGRPDAAVILGASHSGLGGALTVSPDTAWSTPLGEVPLAGDIIEKLASAGIPLDAGAFGREHSLEVELPFLQVLFEEPVPMVPVCVQLAPFARLASGAEALVRASGQKRVWIVASSDFTHYEPDAVARRIDQAALDLILAGDAEGFHRHAVENGLSICGAGAVVVLMLVARSLGLTRARLVDYATSGDVTGDRAAVVGYASVLFSREGR